MILNLDPDFQPTDHLEEISFESFTFSGGEPHIKITSKVPSETNVVVTHRIRSFNDFGLFLLAIDALRRMEVKSIEAIMPYFPAARQDRVMVPGEPLSVKVYAEMINNLKLDKVTVFDPHSEVVPALLDNCHAISNHAFIEKIVTNLPKDLLLVSPDGGALKKIYKLAAHLQHYEVLECSKSRDVKTGALSGFQVYSDDLHGRPCLIVDDICDGGGTFLGLAGELKKKNSGPLYLAVSHGIFNKGYDRLLAEFDKIYTTNSFADHPAIETYSLTF